jgi:multicomponent Na+:H+ antiporter subunit D
LNAVYYLPIIINGFFGEENLSDKIYRSKAMEIKKIMPVIMLIVAMIYVGVASKGIIAIIETGLR